MRVVYEMRVGGGPSVWLPSTNGYSQPSDRKGRFRSDGFVSGGWAEVLFFKRISRENKIVKQISKEIPLKRIKIDCL